MSDQDQQRDSQPAYQLQPQPDLDSTWSVPSDDLDATWPMIHKDEPRAD